MSSFNTFLQLHQQTEPLLIANAWNAQSGIAFEKLNYKALATTSAGVAEALGYPDGEEMSFEEYLFVVKRIRATTSLPLSVDLEGGYGHTTDEIAGNIKRLAAVGVVGINIEDSIIEAGSRKIRDAQTFADDLKEIADVLKAGNTNIFINVRCDAFLLPLPDARNEAIRRIKLYQSTGVHGLFLPCIADEEDIKAVVAVSQLPVNVMCIPGLPDFDKLKSLGVKRISMGNFLNKACYSNIEVLTNQIRKDGSFSSLFQR
jgi:2-methylisocitrate lyase-like PEP mutase family enzyme